MGPKKHRVYPFDPESVKSSTSPGVFDEGSTGEDSDEDAEMVMVKSKPKENQSSQLKKRLYLTVDLKKDLTFL